MSESKRKVLLVGWDGADWKLASPLIDRGELPQLANLVAHGASGPLVSLPPYLSPMLWNSIATGKYAFHHGILGFTTTDPVTGRLAPVTSTQRRCKALWNILSEQGLITHVIGWFASHPAENVTGICVTEAFPRPVARGAPWPVPSGSVHPSELSTELGALRLRPDEVDPAVLRMFVPRAEEIDLKEDRRLEQLAIRLAELYSVHNAAIAALDRGEWNFLAVYYHFIDWVCHDFMDFYPPRRPHVPMREFEWYRDVVDSAYRLSDLLLSDLLAHAGPGTTLVLCSDHGFHSDARRPTRIPMVAAGIAVWHRAQGIFAAAGPGIATDVLVAGATVLDITPTILRLFELPTGADMNGRVLIDAFMDPRPSDKTIPTWENVPGPHARPRHINVLSAADETALLEQFAALGYMDLAPRGIESPARHNDRENRWNLAITLRHAGRNEEALALLEELHLDRPEDGRYAYQLARCQFHLGLHDEAVLTAETLVDFTPGNAHAHELLANLALDRKDPVAALAHLEAIQAGKPAAMEPLHLLARGRALLQQGRILDACAFLRMAVEADQEEPAAWLAYAQGLLAAGANREAEICAREAITLAPTMAAAHSMLGLALTKQERHADAGCADARAEALNPRLATTHARWPFVAATIDLSADLAAKSTVEPLRIAWAQRRQAHAAELVRLRANVTSLVHCPLKSSNTALPAKTDLCFVIVSGLPRSGTSLMMQMLAAGGLPLLTDGCRAADESNPEGYFEWEKIKRLPEDPTVIEHAAGRAVKVVSPLLPHLPRRHRYKVIFMMRPLEEVARSQQRLRARLTGVTDAVENMIPRLAQHAETTVAALRASPHVVLLTVDYPSLVADPVTLSKQVVQFLGQELLPTFDRMTAVVRPELHRQRSKTS
ncbi:MAG TPA: alkaline phosphatase family protein [Opitutaceae bacterium]|nr:alkaline phosphatase family protein [Opitutaceae bacterium]